jgi:hypothetical protein
MKKIQLYVFLIFSIFSSLSGMDTHLQNPYFWIKPKGKKAYAIDKYQAREYPLLRYYISRFGYANTKETPLLIGDKKQLEELKTKQVDSFLYDCSQFFSHKKSAEITPEWKLKLEDAVAVKQNLPGDVNGYIVRFLKRLSDNKKLLPCVFTALLSLKARPYHNYERKYFFGNKEFYWTADENIYDKKGNNILTIDTQHQINHGLSFSPAYRGHAVLHLRGYGIAVYDLNSGSEIILRGSLTNFDISPDGRYVAVRLMMRNAIDIYRTDNTDDPIARMHYDNDLCDFIFSPDGSKIVSYGNEKIIVWDLENIESITSKEFQPAIRCKAIVFNEDSEHMCIINSSRSYNYSNNKFDEVQAVAILNIKSGKKIKTVHSYGATSGFIFPDKSDVVMLNDTKKGTTILLHKKGKIFGLPQAYEGNRYEINGNYVLVSKENNAYIFDHRMNFLGKICSYPDPIFSLEPRTQNAIIAKDDGWNDTEKSLYFPIAKKSTIAQLKKISETITVQQFVILEWICSQERAHQEILVLDNKDIQEIFKSFTLEHQKFLQEKLFLVLPS